MSWRTFFLFVLFLLIPLQATSWAQEMKAGEFLVLTYHAVLPKASPSDRYTLSQDLFTKQMEYLRTHGYHPVSLDDILKARLGQKSLPSKPVLLSFDDAYLSYYQVVVPLLKKYGFPSLLAVVGRFMENPPPALPEPLLTWKQIRELAAQKGIEVASHSYDLHKDIPYNPQGNVGPAAALRGYDPKTREYESEEAYGARIREDFEKQKALFNRELLFIPRAMVWPYGWHTAISRNLAREAGFQVGFTTEEGYAHLDRLEMINRNLVRNGPMMEFIKMVKNPDGDRPLIRAVQVDLDLIYDPRGEDQTDQNLGKLIDRLVAMEVNTIYLQAFADPEGTGNIKSVYFPNRVLPVESDLFSHAVHQFFIRGFKVYAWMPSLSLELPDQTLNEQLKVLEKDAGSLRPSKSWYRRLSPFDPRVKELVGSLFEDMAAHSLIRGILFQDDAYLTDREDYHPAALAAYKNRFGETAARLDQDPESLRIWGRYKSETLIQFTRELMSRVRNYRPHALSARNLYAITLMEPESETWFAQNYEGFLKEYDYVVIMAYPQLEKTKDPRAWLQQLTQKAKKIPGGIPRSVFKLQAYDWGIKRWLADEFLLEEMRDILSQGGIHLAYYPDDLWINKPNLETVRLEMSRQTYPFKK
jgi:poly-beta-1,6-N-acetyl-D-glucosamine N-deacetylase